jgi:transcription antitermination factor NusG
MAEYCGIHRFDYYLPLRHETKIYQRRKVSVDKPVFPGYVFVSFDRPGRVVLLRSNHIVRILTPVREDLFLQELDQVRKALAVDPTLGSCNALQAGKRVRIVAGPFMGIEGLISGLKSRTVVRLNVDLIAQAVALEIEREYLELID